jgi:hypothetical protein
VEANVACFRIATPSTRTPASTRRSRRGRPRSSLQPGLWAVPPTDAKDVSSTIIFSAHPTDALTVSTHSKVAKVSEVRGSISDLSYSSISD